MSNSGYLLIADISGYTNFVKLHNLRQKNVLGKIIADNFEFHAEAIVSDLLESQHKLFFINLQTLISFLDILPYFPQFEVIEPTLKLNKLEGDAAFFYIESNDSKNQADDIIRIMDKANESFNEKASSLVFVRACGCEPCLESKNLRLKIVAHKGNFAIKKIRNFEELAGEDVIFTHRMLKNGIESNEYWLVTDSFYKELNPSNKAKFTSNTQVLENFGKVKLNYLQLSSPEPRNSKVESRSRIVNWLAQAAYFGKENSFILIS